MDREIQDQSCECSNLKRQINVKMYQAKAKHLKNLQKQAVKENSYLVVNKRLPSIKLSKSIF